MIYDGVIIGGGPAGMMAAIMSARQGSRVLLLEKNDRLGKKLLITGKGRCNVCNNCTVEEVLKNIPRNGRFLYSCLHGFGPEDTIRFFEELGCPLKTERGNRVFPVSDSAKSILDALKKGMKTLPVTVRHTAVKSVLVSDGAVRGVETDVGPVSCRWVLVATGGLSYPTTGSTGDGYKIASALGHTVVPCQGSLVPLVTEGPDCAEMQGLSLRNIGLRLVDAKGKTLFQDLGELLFTHFGVSGPLVLSASAHLKGACALVIDLKPGLDMQKLEARLLRDLEQYKNRTMENALTDLLPRSMIPVILRRAQIGPDLQANALRREDRRNLVACIKGFLLNILERRPVAEAIITSGGVKCNEIDPKTMESKLVSGLFFAGEVIDCDGYTGGFNLQIAWSTAVAAGRAAVEAFPPLTKGL